MDELFFIYDKLLTKQERDKIHLDLQFISLAQMQGKMYWYTDSKKKWIFAVPQDTSKVIYGGLFLMKDYDLHKHRIHAYYNNSIGSSGKTFIENTYDLSNVQVRPIKISSLSDLLTGRYKVGDGVDCKCFVGNLQNNRMNFNSKRQRYYGTQRIDKESFITLIEEQNGGHNGLE